MDLKILHRLKYEIKKFGVMFFIFSFLFLFGKWLKLCLGERCHVENGIPDVAKPILLAEANLDET